jgi:hypothetical protein
VVSGYLGLQTNPQRSTTFIAGFHGKCYELKGFSIIFSRYYQLSTPLLKLNYPTVTHPLESCFWLDLMPKHHQIDDLSPVKEVGDDNEFEKFIGGQSHGYHGFQSPTLGATITKIEKKNETTARPSEYKEYDLSNDDFDPADVTSSQDTESRELLELGRICRVFRADARSGIIGQNFRGVKGSVSRHHNGTPNSKEAQESSSHPISVRGEKTKVERRATRSSNKEPKKCQNIHTEESSTSPTDVSRAFQKYLLENNFPLPSWLQER